MMFSFTQNQSIICESGELLVAFDLGFFGMNFFSISSPEYHIINHHAVFADTDCVRLMDEGFY